MILSNLVRKDISSGAWGMVHGSYILRTFWVENAISTRRFCYLPIQPHFTKGENGESLKFEANESLRISILGSRLLMLRWTTAMRDASKLRLGILLFTEEKKTIIRNGRRYLNRSSNKSTVYKREVQKEGK